MRISTNRLQVEFNIESIRRDFVFIRFEKRTKSNNWFGSEQLDLLLCNKFRAFATMYQHSRFAYAMFKRPIDVYELISNFKRDELFADDAVIEVIPTVEINNQQDQYIMGEWLAQILLNSLSSSRSKYDKYQFCNLTGSLLIILKKTNNNFFDVAKITVEKDWLLLTRIIRYRSLVDVRAESEKTFNQKRKQELFKALKKPIYKFKDLTGNLVRHLTSDGEPDSKSTFFVECGLTNKKASSLFLEFKNLDTFEKSRAGVFHKVLNLIEEKLSEYITVQLSQRVIGDECILKTSLIKNTEKVNSLMSDKTIHIVDTIDDEESKTTVKKLKKLIKEDKAFSSANITDGKKDNSNSLNIRIIHEKSYYKKDEQKDDYVSSDANVTRQNITIESLNSSENWESVITTGIKELLIKQDIINCKFSLFNWSDLQLSGVWTFAVLEQENNHVVFMEVETDGSFQFYHFDIDFNLLTWERFEKYRTALIKNKKLYLEGVVVSSDGDINQIFRTEEITIPNLEEIHSILHQIDSELPESISTGNALSKIASQFLEIYTPINKEKFEFLIDSLNQIGQKKISKLDFYGLIKNILGSAKGSANTKDSIQLRDYMLEKFGVRFILTKDKETTEELFNSSVDIKYFGESDREAYYFVGNSRASIQSSFKDSCHLRKITVLPDSKDKLVFSKLLPTMDVDFVRTGQSTVIPFPFKYIREYIKLTKNK